MFAQTLTFLMILLYFVIVYLCQVNEWDLYFSFYFAQQSAPLFVFVQSHFHPQAMKSMKLLLHTIIFAVRYQFRYIEYQGL